MEASCQPTGTEALGCLRRPAVAAHQTPLTRAAHEVRKPAARLDLWRGVKSAAGPAPRGRGSRWGAALSRSFHQGRCRPVGRDRRASLSMLPKPCAMNEAGAIMAMLACAACAAAP